MKDMQQDWKLKLRYGQLQTPFKHLTIIAGGIADHLRGGFVCKQGNAYMGMKAWVISDEDAATMIQAIAEDIGFKVTGDIQIYYTDPLEPPRGTPYAYDIKFTEV